MYARDAKLTVAPPLRSTYRNRRALVLDVEPFSALRPDAHGASGRNHNKDCLHFQLPGVPDTWNHLLVSAVGWTGK